MFTFSHESLPCPDWGNDDNAANLAVSDHRPVWAKFRTDKDDDGAAQASTTGSGESGNTTWGQIRALHLKIEHLQEQINTLSERLDVIEQAMARIEQAKPTTVDQANAEPADDVTVYITRTGKKYHKAGCSYLRKSAIPIKKSEAIGQGYTPCIRYKP